MQIIKCGQWVPTNPPHFCNNTIKASCVECRTAFCHTHFVKHMSKVHKEDVALNYAIPKTIEGIVRTQV